MGQSQSFNPHLSSRLSVLNCYPIPDRSRWPAATVCLQTWDPVNHALVWSAPPWICAGPATQFNQRKVVELSCAGSGPNPYEGLAASAFVVLGALSSHGLSDPWRQTKSSRGETTWRERGSAIPVCQLSPAFQPTAPGTRHISAPLWTFQLQPPSDHSPTGDPKQDQQENCPMKPQWGQLLN